VNDTKRHWLQERPLLVLAVGALLGGLGAATADKIVGGIGSLAAAGAEPARKLFESTTETEVREYVESVENSRLWGDDGAILHEASRELLVADWKALSPYKVREHRPHGKRVDLDELYRDTELLADRPVVLEAFVTAAYSKPFPGYPEFVYQDLRLGVRGQETVARCDITRPRNDRFDEGDFLELNGVAVASGTFSYGPLGTYLACSSAERKEP